MDAMMQFRAANFKSAQRRALTRSCKNLSSLKRLLTSLCDALGALIA
jgi:hypothetical protein